MKSLFTCLVLAAFSAVVRAESPMQPERLQCEYRANPQGIDVQRPRLSWIVASTARGDRQTAYRVLVATNEDGLKADRGDLWDSGKVASDETTCIEYAGKPLGSSARCCWKVQVWDKDGNASAWSPAARWSMGLLAPGDWKAQWIGYDKARALDSAEAPLAPAKWIWHAADSSPNAPQGHRLFVSTLEVPGKVKKAELLVTADDKYKFVINGTLVAGNEPGQDSWKVVRTIDVTTHLTVGANSLRVEVENATPSPAGLVAKLTVTTEDGKTIACVTDGTWKTTDNAGANWHNRPLDTAAWPAARVLGEVGMAPWGKPRLAELVLPPPSYLRAEFRVSKPVRNATLYASALGNFDLHLNGERVADEQFSPGWTDYTKRVYYRTYDVTEQVRTGENALGAILADGWYSGHIGWGRIRDHYGKLPRFLGQLRIEYADGSIEVIATGPNWKAATGPIREADFLMGESYDARRELTGWDTAGFDAKAWAPVVVGAEKGMAPLVQAHPGPPVVVYGEFKAKKITQPTPGVYVLDLGRNFAGVARLTVSGKAGQQIQLRFAERLNPDGTIYTTNLRGARCVDTYICKGDGVETWQPRFTFHGFQYVEATGLTEPPKADTVVGLALSSDTPVAGSFACSDPMLNQLHSNIYYTQRSNFIDIPTDCPQRDERLGWTGDAQVYIRTATLNTDVHAFFTKWLVDLEDGQRKDGQFPMIAPVKVAGDDGGPAWSDAGVICPWTVYWVYGDRRVLEQHYRSMVRFVEFCRSRSTPDLLPPKQFHCFGDWLSINADTPKEVIFTAYFAYSTRLTARTAEVLGRADDAARYSELFERIKAAFNKAYVAPDGRIQGNTQACYVLALAFDLLDEPQQKLAARYLVEDIEKRGNHLSTGFIGTKDLMLALSKIGRNDVAYRLLHNDTFPSWGFSIKHGATSIWERWDGWTPEKGFQDPGMNSFAHYSFGAVYQWIVENVGGIRSEAPGYKKIVIAPQVDGKLTHATVAYNSVRGYIISGWKRDGDRLVFEVTIPANTTATVLLPAKMAREIPLAEMKDVKSLGVDAGVARLEIGSGTYQFTTR